MYFFDSSKDYISQGDIFRDFRFIRWIEKVGDNFRIDVIKIPFFAVLTQACDLDQDFKERMNENGLKSDKIIQSILVCPAYLAEEVKAGEHLLSLDIKGNIYGSRDWEKIESNNNKRYHFLKGDEKIGIPDIVLDFKQYYALPSYILYKMYKTHYLCSMENLFKEDLSHRFAFYLSRIGLPDLKPNEED